jgi:hypothetical protein
MEDPEDKKLLLNFSEINRRIGIHRASMSRKRIPKRFAKEVDLMCEILDNWLELLKNRDRKEGLIIFKESLLEHSGVNKKKKDEEFINNILSEFATYLKDS